MLPGQGGGWEEPALAEDIIDSLMLVDGMFAQAAAPVPAVVSDTQASLLPGPQPALLQMCQFFYP